jgi:hypothetical protein
MLASVTAYLRPLPTGLASCPEAAVRGSVVGSMIAASDIGARLSPGQVPPEVEALVREPPPRGAWIPEVHFSALLAAIYELCFKRGGGVFAFDRWTLEVNRKLLGGPLYKAIFHVVSAEQLFRGVERRWGAFHRGSMLKLTTFHGYDAELELRYHSHLFSDVSLRSIASGLRAAGEAAGLRWVDVTLAAETPAKATFMAIWK